MTIHEHGTITDSVEDVDLPPIEISSDFRSVHYWLSTICGGHGPKTPVGYYSLGLFESPDSAVIFLVGMTRNGNHDAIAFKPPNMYFLLPKEYDLKDQQLSTKLQKEIIDFTETKEFASSFFVKSDRIDFKGKGIWSKK